MSTLRRQDRMVVIQPPRPPPPSDQGLAIRRKPAPSKGQRQRHPPLVTRRQATGLTHPQQSANVIQQPLQPRDTSVIPLAPPHHRSRFATHRPCREGALYGEAAFQRLRIPRPLRRTYAFWKHLPRNEHLPLLNTRPLRQENAFYGGLPLAAPTRRGVKQGVKFLRRPAGPSAKAAVLGQPKSILKKPKLVKGSLHLVSQDGPVARTWGKFRYFPNVGGLEHWATTDRWVDQTKSSKRNLVCKGCGQTVALGCIVEPPKRMKTWKTHKKGCMGIYKTEYHERNDLIYRNNPSI